MAAVTDAYATALEYRTGISPNKTDISSDVEILNDITAISRWLDRRLDRFFTKDAAAVARDFYGPSSGSVNPEAENPFKGAGGFSRILHLDADLVSVTSILTDDGGVGTPSTTWAVTDYQLFPLNAAKGSEPRPYNAISVPSYSAQSGWPSARLIRVTGIWGWPAVPAAIKRGVINITAILRLETPRAVSTTNDIGSVVGANREARGIVDDLVRLYGRASF